MRYEFLIAGFLMASCGAVQKGIDQAKEIDAMNKTDTNTATATDVKTGSKTVTTSTTTTISESGDQSVFTDNSVSNGVQKNPVVNVVQKPVNPIVGAWYESCDDGIAYKKDFGADGMLTVTTYVFDNQVCDGSITPPQVFVQKRKYRVDQDSVQIGNDAPISISISGDNNTVIIGNTELQKH